MVRKLVRSETEIDNVYDSAMQANSNGSKFPGMTYEDGIIAMLEWLVGERDEEPMED